MPACRIRAVCTCVPERRVDNLAETTEFPPEEVDKVVKLAGVRARHVASDSLCSSDLCCAAARRVLAQTGWTVETIDALVFVTQTPDYFLPSTACLAQHRLGLPDTCAAFDVGLGCSGYPYGLWLATMMLTTAGLKRVLVLHGETPTRFAAQSDRAVALLFGDAGSATALEVASEPKGPRWWFDLHSDGSGARDLMLEGGGFRNRTPADPQQNFVFMHGAKIFNFTIKRVPAVVEATLQAAGITREMVDYFIFHQSNLFIMRHLAKKLGIAEEKLPVTLPEFGSAGGPSVPLTITQGGLRRPSERSLQLLLVGYGVGLSWATALVTLPPDAVLDHLEIAG